MAGLFDKFIMMELLAETWDLAPDLRLGQLIVNIIFEKAETIQALFYMEDEVFEEEMLKFREKVQKDK
jgi:hypothetical protein